MRAFLEDVMKNNSVTALDFYTSALEVLQWGREMYKDVSYSDKGQIFQPTFIRGVKRLRLDTFMKVRLILYPPITFRLTWYLRRPTRRTLARTPSSHCQSCWRGPTSC